MNDNHALDETTLNLLWKCQEGKHEETVWSVFETINSIAPSLKQDHLFYLFAKIKTIPKKEYTEMILKFIKEFTESALHWIRSIKSNENFEPWFSVLQDEENENQEKLSL